MMLNDVVESTLMDNLHRKELEIKRKQTKSIILKKAEQELPINLNLIDTEEKNPDESSQILISMDNWMISRLKEADDPNHKLLIILQQFFDKKESHLTYKEKTQIRSDVLTKLYKIIEFLKQSEGYPDFNKSKIENAIENVLGKVDIRTHREYFKSFESVLGRITNFGSVDIRPFIKELSKK